MAENRGAVLGPALHGPGEERDSPRDRRRKQNLLALSWPDIKKATITFFFSEIFFFFFFTTQVKLSTENVYPNRRGKFS